MSRSASRRRSPSPGCCSWSATPSTAPRGGPRTCRWPRLPGWSRRWPRSCGGRPSVRSTRACCPATSSSRKPPRSCAAGCARASSCTATTGCRCRWRSATTSSPSTSPRTRSCVPPASGCSPCPAWMPTRSSCCAVCCATSLTSRRWPAGIRSLPGSRPGSTPATTPRSGSPNSCCGRRPSSRGAAAWQ